MKKSVCILLLLLSISVFAQDTPKTTQDTPKPAPPKKIVPESKMNADAKPVALSYVPLAKSKKFTLVAYGDTRSTDPKEVAATDPRIRLTLVKQIASEKPSAVLISGDLFWHGGDENDWQQY